MKMYDPKIWRLCLVTDRPLAKGRPLVEIVEAAVRGGVTMVQLREKDCTTRDFLTEARALKDLLTPLGVPLIINDRVDIALAVDAEGVHVGQTDMPVEIVRKLVGPDKIVGISITSERQMAAAANLPVDYCGVGPLFPQNTKATQNPPLGPEGFGKLRAMTKRPLMAIGGLKADNSAPVVAAGADGLAVVSAIVGADDPDRAAREFAGLFSAR